MPLQVDTLTTINSRVQSDINANIPGADSRLRRSTLGAIAYMMAKWCWAFYQFLVYVSKQRLPDTMDDDNLANFGGLFGVPEQGATFAAGTATIAAGTAGEPIPAGTTVQTANQVEYVTQGAVNVANDGTATLTLLAAVAGSSGNQVAGTQLTFLQPVAGVPAVATVVQISGGLDIEDTDNYRGRIIDHLQSPPQGGTPNDYVGWARTQAGVTRAWCQPDYMGPGTVGVFFVFDGRANIFPLAADVTAMQAFLKTKATQGDTVYAVAPIANPIAHTIQLTNPADGPTQAAITAELTDLYARAGAPGASIDISFVRDAVGLGAGTMAWRLPVPNASITNTAAQMPTLGAITWQPIT